jgi:hypothetical protein
MIVLLMSWWWPWSLFSAHKLFNDQPHGVGGWSGRVVSQCLVKHQIWNRPFLPDPCGERRFARCSRIWTRKKKKKKKFHEQQKESYRWKGVTSVGNEHASLSHCAIPHCDTLDKPGCAHFWRPPYSLCPKQRSIIRRKWSNLKSEKKWKGKAGELTTYKPITHFSWSSSNSKWLLLG